MNMTGPFPMHEAGGSRAAPPRPAVPDEATFWVCVRGNYVSYRRGEDYRNYHSCGPDCGVVPFSDVPKDLQAEAAELYGVTVLIPEGGW